MNYVWIIFFRLMYEFVQLYGLIAFYKSYFVLCKLFFTIIKTFVLKSNIADFYKVLWKALNFTLYVVKHTTIILKAINMLPSSSANCKKDRTVLLNLLQQLVALKTIVVRFTSYGVTFRGFHSFSSSVYFFYFYFN